MPTLVYKQARKKITSYSNKNLTRQFREAAKKGIFFSGPGLATKKKYLFLKLEKNIQKMLWQLSSRGGAGGRP